MLIDTHCHLNDEQLVERADEIVGAFSRDGIECAVCVGYDVPSSVLAKDLAQRYEKLYFAAGIHPHDSKTATADAYDELRALATDGKCVADWRNRA